MKFSRCLSLVTVIGLTAWTAAEAGVYACVNAKGERSISDKPCSATQTPQKIYVPPSAPEPLPEPVENLAPDLSLTPQTPEELKAMLRARERAAQGLASDDEEELLRQQALEKEYRRKTETKRQMETYLNEREKRRQEWRDGTRDAEPEPDYAAQNQERRQQYQCESLLQRKRSLDAAQRRGHSSSSGEYFREQDREISAQLYQYQCKR